MARAQQISPQTPPLKKRGRARPVKKPPSLAFTLEMQKPQYTEVTIRLETGATATSSQEAVTFNVRELLKCMNLAISQIPGKARADEASTKIAIAQDHCIITLQVALPSCRDSEQHAASLYQRVVEQSKALEHIQDAPHRQVEAAGEDEVMLKKLRSSIQTEKKNGKLTGGKPVETTFKVSGHPPVTTIVGSSDQHNIQQALRSVNSTLNSKTDKYRLIVTRISDHDYFWARTETTSTERKYKLSEGLKVAEGEPVLATVEMRKQRDIDYHQLVLALEPLEQK